MKLVPPFGSRSAKIAIVGEAPGAHEEKLGLPFSGAGGQELEKMMLEAGLKKASCYQTNVFKERPPNNDIASWYVSKKDLPASYPMPALAQGKYICPSKLHYVEELLQELAEVDANIFLLCGNTATWAVLQQTGIAKLRGLISSSAIGKCLPIYHPAAILRQWNYRSVTVADLMKAKLESEHKEIVRPNRTLLIEPTFEEALAWMQKVPTDCLLSFDIETKGGSITCIGFSYDASSAICIPFFDARKADGNYWTDPYEEVSIWSRVKHLLKTRETLAQNGLYDVQYLYRYAGIRTKNITHDTMLLHHSLYPEMKKGLGFLASIYTNELSWKSMVKDLGRDK